MWFRVSRVRAPYPTPLVGGSGITPGPPRLSHFGMSPSGKAQDFDSCIRAFEPRHPSQCGLALPARRSDSVAQQAEQLPFKQWVRGSNPRWVTKKRKPVIRWDCGFFFIFQCFPVFSALQNIETHFKKKKAKTEFCKQVCLLFCLLFACDKKAARISPGGSLYFSHDFFSMSISETMPGYCFFSSENLARAARRSFPGNVSVSVSTLVPSS